MTFEVMNYEEVRKNLEKSVLGFQQLAVNNIKLTLKDFMSWLWYDNESDIAYRNTMGEKDYATLEKTDPDSMALHFFYMDEVSAGFPEPLLKMYNVSWNMAWISCVLLNEKKVNWPNIIKAYLPEVSSDLKMYIMNQSKKDPDDVELTIEKLKKLISKFKELEQ